MRRSLAPGVIDLVARKENLIAVALCLIAVALVIATTSSAPQWIYQGF